MSTKGNSKSIERALVVARAFMPFYGPVLYSLRFKPVEETHTPTAATNNNWVMFYNEEWFDDLPPAQAGAVLCHEVGHLVKDAFRRAESREFKVWNIAQDFIINYELNELGKGRVSSEADSLKTYLESDFRMPDDTLTAQQYGLPEGWLEDDYYDALMDMKDLEDKMGMHGDGVGNGSCGSAADGTQDPSNRGQGHMTEYDKERAVDGAMKEIAEAANRNAGNVPSSLSRMAEDYLNRQNRVNWRNQLQNVVNWFSQMVAGQADYASQKIRQRNPNPDLFLSGLVAYEPNVLFAFDTSGSMSAGDLERTAVEACGIVQSMMGTPTFVSIDADMAEPSKSRNVKEWIEQGGLVGGGGTDMSIAVTYADEKKFDLVIIGTDGYTPWSDEVPRTNVVVLMTQPDSGQYDNVPDNGKYTVLDVSEQFD